jgi:hypothetical protein
VNIFNKIKPTKKRWPKKKHDNLESILYMNGGWSRGCALGDNLHYCFVVFVLLPVMFFWFSWTAVLFSSLCYFFCCLFFLFGRGLYPPSFCICFSGVSSMPYARFSLFNKYILTVQNKKSSSYWIWSKRDLKNIKKKLNFLMQ